MGALSLALNQMRHAIADRGKALLIRCAPFCSEARPRLAGFAAPRRQESDAGIALVHPVVLALPTLFSRRQSQLGYQIR